MRAESRQSTTPDTADLAAVPDYDRLFHDEYPKMVALAASVAGDRDHAEDIAQEALGRLAKNWSSVQGYDKPGAWLRRVTINLALSRRRRLASEAKALLRLPRPEPTLPPAPTDDAAVWRAVASLPGKQRAVVSLHFLEDLPLIEIADILDISPSTARVHLHRARQTLRDQLEEVDR